MRRWLASYTAYFKARATPSLWHELKVHQKGGEAKKQGRVGGEEQKILADCCCHQVPEIYPHLRKVIPRIIELNGNATGY